MGADLVDCNVGYLTYHRCAIKASPIIVGVLTSVAQRIAVF